MAKAKLVCALLLCMVLSTPMLTVEASLPCHTVGVYLEPCLNYLQKGGRVPPRCCRGVRIVSSSAKTTTDRRKTCSCLKSTANMLGLKNDKYAAALPGICNARIPSNIRISKSTNCKSIP